MSDKPLYVRVAEILGWTGIFYGQKWIDIDDGKPEGALGWLGYPPCGHVNSAGIVEVQYIRDYALDWSITGPLIERFSLDIYRKAGNSPWTVGIWIPNDEPYNHYVAIGDTPLLAICNLLVAHPEIVK